MAGAELDEELESDFDELESLEPESLEPESLEPESFELELEESLLSDFEPLSADEELEDFDPFDPFEAERLSLR